MNDERLLPLMMKILETVKNCRSIGISGHENPDGDCVGACCGLALYLRNAMPDAKVDIYLEPFREALMRNTPGAETVLHEAPKMLVKYDAFIVLDSMPDRIGFARDLYETADLKVNIDHHKTNPGCGDFFYVDGDASSACELVYHTMDEALVSRSIAQALYLGLVSDTGVFQYSNTKASTLILAGKLISYGFDFTTLNREVFHERTYVQAKMLGLALAGSELILEGKCMFSVMDRETVTKYGALRKDFERISEQMLLTRGADCAVFIHETDPGEWRVSMRSGKIVDVAKTASLFGGGGHTRAAGCTIRANTKAAFAEAVKILKEDISGQLEAFRNG